MKNLKYYIATLLVVGAVVLLGAHSVKANPSVLPPSVQTATATTSAVFIGTGTATSTLVYDSYSNGTPTKSTNASLLVQFAASNTASVLGINVEYAYGTAGVNCATTQAACDWYADNTTSLATSSGVSLLQTANSFSWTFASSTRGGAALTNANSATSTKLITIQAPLRYTRVIFSMTGAPGAIWAQIAPVKEVGNIQ